MKGFLLIIPLLLLNVSCVMYREKQASQPVPDAVTGADQAPVYPASYELGEQVQAAPPVQERTFFALGGRGLLKFPGNDGGMLMWDARQSFRDGALVAAGGITTLGNVATQKAAEGTAQVVAREVTKRRAAEEVTKQATTAARESVTNTALRMEMPVKVKAP